MRAGKSGRREANLALILCCIVVVFFLCHIPRVVLTVHEWLLTEDMIRCSHLLIRPAWNLGLTSLNQLLYSRHLLLAELYAAPAVHVTTAPVVHQVSHLHTNCTFAAPTADAEAEAQYLAYGHGLVGGVYAAAPVVPEVNTVELKAAPVAAVAYAAPAVHVATAPVVHHQVHHVPKVTVHAFSGVVPVAGVPVVAAVLAELYGPFQLLLLSTTASLG